MARYSDKYTDRELEKLERRIAEQYRIANKELKEKADTYFKKLQKRYEKEYQAYQNGAYTEDQFRAWYRSQVGRGKRWEALRDDMAKRLTGADQISADYINDTTPGIFAENYNYEAYTIEQEYGNVAFNIIDENTVKNLMTSKREILPKMNIDVPYDMEWNQKKLENALLQGILQGDSINHLADRFQNVGIIDRNAAIRNARTAVTGAQNSGRLQTMKDAEDMGIKVQKQWMATLDSRTRERHQKMDGVVVDNDEHFPNGLMYPGDMDGDPAEVYNCRCTMIAAFPDHGATKRIMRDEDGKWTYSEDITYTGVGGTKSYKDWLKDKTENITTNTTTSANKSVIIDIKKKQKIKYKLPTKEEYQRVVDEGDLTPLATYDFFIKKAKKASKKLIGLKTSDGLEVKSISVHFVARLIGSIEKKRKGVSIEAVKNTLISKDATIIDRVGADGEPSRKYRYNKMEVTINPRTNNLVQTNPNDKVKKKDGNNKGAGNKNQANNG